VGRAPDGKRWRPITLSKSWQKGKSVAKDVSDVGAALAAALEAAGAFSRD